MRQLEKAKTKNEDAQASTWLKHQKYPETTIPTSCITVQDVGISFLFV